MKKMICLLMLLTLFLCACKARNSSAEISGTQPSSEVVSGSDEESTGSEGSTDPDSTELSTESTTAPETIEVNDPSKLYQTYRVNTNPPGHMIYPVYHDTIDVPDPNDIFNSPPLTIVDENWKILASYLRNSRLRYIYYDKNNSGKEDYRWGVSVINDSDPSKSFVMTIDGKKVDALQGMYLREGKGDFAVIVKERYSGGDVITATGVFNLRTGKIVIAPTYKSLDIVDKTTIFAYDGSTGSFRDMNGNIKVNLPGVTEVYTQGYDGKGILLVSQSEIEGDSEAYPTGYIDLSGKWIYKSDQDRLLEPFIGNHAKISDTEVIDRTGKITVLPFNLFTVFEDYIICKDNNDTTLYKNSDLSIHIKIVDFLADSSYYEKNVMLGTRLSVPGYVFLVNVNGSEIAKIKANFGFFSEGELWTPTEKSSVYNTYDLTGKFLGKIDTSKTEAVKTEDERFLVAKNNLADGFKDMSGKWVFKMYSFGNFGD